MYGCELRATRPMAPPSIGVSRQPSTRQAFFGYDPLQHAFRLQACARLHRQECHADAVFARRRQRESQPGAFPREVFVRNLDQHAGAVAGFRIASAGAAMGQVHQNLNALDDNVVRFLTLDVRHEPDAAGIVFQSRIVKALGGR